MFSKQFKVLRQELLITWQEPQQNLAEQIQFHIFQMDIFSFIYQRASSPNRNR